MIEQGQGPHDPEALGTPTETQESYARRLVKSIVNPPPIPEKRPQRKKGPFSILSRIFFVWPTSLVWAAWYRDLDINDIEEIEQNRRVGVKVHIFEGHFSRLQAKKAAYPLLRAIVATFPRQTSLAVLSSIGYLQVMLWSSLIFRYFGQYLDAAYRQDHSISKFRLLQFGQYLEPAYHANNAGDHASSMNFGVLIALAFASAFYVALWMQSHAVYYSTMLGGEVRTLLGAAMYAKSFRIARTALRPQYNRKVPEAQIDGTLAWKDPNDKEGKQGSNERYWSTGVVLNSMSVDTERIEEAIASIPNTVPFFSSIPTVVSIAYWFMNWTGVVGAAALYSSIPFVMWMIFIVGRQRREINALGKKRSEILLDMLRGARFLKIFGWETIFLGRVNKLREEEGRRLMRIQLRTVAGWISAFTISRAPALIATGLYSRFFDISESPEIMAFQFLAGNAGNAVAMVMFHTPDVVLAWPSMQDVQDYLAAKEQTSVSSSLNIDTTSELAVDLQGAEFSWHDARVLASLAATDYQAHFRLQDITLQVRRGELLAVVGAVRAGKSSLGSAIAGHMVHLGGNATLGVSPNNIAYCAQKPWIQNAKVRDNITFGLPYDPEKYEKVLDAAGLRRDVEFAFPNKNDTMLGEDGITISGGQKARIQLARVLYRDSSKLYILDDPLSAVDAHTRRDIMQRGILQHLAGRTRILITHQLQYASQCDRVAWISNGRVRAIGHYSELLATEPDFVTFMATTAKDTHTEGLDDDDSPEELEKQRAKHKKEVKQHEDELMAKEEPAVHSVPWSLHRTYMRLGSPWWVLISLVTIVVLSQIFNSLYDQSISWWTSDYWHMANWKYPILLVSLIVAHSLTWGTYYVGIIDVYINAGQKMSKQAFVSLMRAPMSFFDKTPLGQMMNTCNSDVNDIDTILPQTTWNFTLGVTFLVSLIVPIIVYVPLSGVLFVPWCLTIFILVWFYGDSPLGVRRLEALRKSHFFAHLSEGLIGHTALVTCDRQKEFEQKLHATIDELNSIHFMGFGADGWIMHCTSLISAFFTWLVGVLVVRQRHSLSPALGMLMFFLSPILSRGAQMVLRCWSKFQRGMNAVERVNKYRVDLPQEGALTVPAAVPSSWPSRGGIDIHDAHMRYHPNNPLVLRGVTMNVLPGEKVGIVGRTGAGKSTLLAMLLRMVNLESGTIKIDGIDIAKIGLHDLRTKIAVIPQDPTLFVDNVRVNLDPSGEKTDEELEAALRAVSLISDDSENESDEVLDSNSGKDKLQLTLDSTVESEGANFSSGDRQLMALARALVRDAKIIVIDEATANVDPETDEHVQKTLRTHFGDRTILAIAHRLRTVIGYDKICVMDAGRVAQFGTPIDLWGDKAGIFRGMCDASGIVEGDMAKN